MSGCGLMLGARSDMSAPVGSWRALEDVVPNNGGTPMRVLIVHPGVYVYRGAELLIVKLTNYVRER